MKKVNITTPENIELEVVLAEATSRTAAALIDMMIQGVVLFLLFCGALTISKEIAYEDDKMLFGFIWGGLLIIYFLIIYGYFMFFEIKWCGQTIGKRLLNIRVIKNNGGPVTFKEVAIRNLFRVVIDNTGIGVILMFFTKNNKRLGDMAAGTMVIIEEKQKRPAALEEMISITDEIKSYLSEEEYNLLREYFERKSTMTNYEPLRKEMIDYFTQKFTEAGIYEKNQDFINQI